MVTRTRLRAVLTALCLYTVAAAIIGYFGLSAYTGAHGLKAKQDLAQQQMALTREFERVTAERKEWEHRLSPRPSPKTTMRPTRARRPPKGPGRGPRARTGLRNSPRRRNFSPIARCWRSAALRRRPARCTAWV